VPDAGTGTDVVLRATGLSVDYEGARATHAVRDVTLELRRGEVLGLAGESGCGKSTLAFALARLLRPPARLSAGRLEFFARGADEPLDIMALGPAELRQFRWSKVAMVFQSAMNALNPVISLRKQFDDIFITHRPDMTRAQRLQRSRELLDMVGIDPARVDGFAHELSGGMRQRVMIAMALALRPEVVIMDEPTTALDVVVQREILEEVKRLREELGFAVLFITHDLSLLLEISDRLAIMYAGEVVEYAPASRSAVHPAHPYTHGLLGSFPDMTGERRRFEGIPGTPPDLRQAITGCSFAARCGREFEPCQSIAPRLRPLAQDTAAPWWRVACHLHDPRYAPGGPPADLSEEAS
jgi:peptide/nickel transport system ATP-binding protein